MPRKITARTVAVRALERVDQGAFVNLAVPHLLERSGLDERDRHFATELAYGVTRMRRACDFLIDRFLMKSPDRQVRNVLRVGAYQLAYTSVPAHAAVSATVDEAPGRAKAFVNAILRKVADDPHPEWPDLATRLSYPDWIVQRLVDDLGESDAVATLEQMNKAPDVTRRDDGYVQDLASQRVAEAVGVQPGDLVADICAAPGGKATLFGHAGAAFVAALDVQPQRTRLIAKNAAAVGTSTVVPIVADGRRPPLREKSFDRVLLDAPCSGLGVLRRRPDARWRLQPEFIRTLTALQRDLVDRSVDLVKPGGVFVYSVCTMTSSETEEIAAWLEADPRRGDFELISPPAEPWQPTARGARLLPHVSDTDGMYILRMRRAPR